jgi:tripeptidyl-peptidase-1
MRLSAAFSLVLLQLVAGGPLAKRWDDFRTKHEWAEIPRGWQVHSDAPADHVLEMRIGLKQDKFDELVRHLYEVSDPDHERYVVSLICPADI